MHSGTSQKLRRGRKPKTRIGRIKDHLLLRSPSIPCPWSLVKGELDEHFGFPVVERIEQANDYFRTKLVRFSTPRKFGAIYADPPWSFRNWSAKGTGRNAVSHYDCLDFAALAHLPISDFAANDCVLFLWATDPLLPRAIELIQAWGFEFKTVAFYWVKLNSAARHDADYFTGLG